MKQARRSAVHAGWLLAILAGVLALLPSVVAAKTIAPLPESDYGVRHVCSAATHGHASCLALELAPRTKAAIKRTHPIGMTLTVVGGAGAAAKGCEAATGCYGLRPEDLRSAYFHGEAPDAPESGGASQTIALVDAYNDLNAAQDLAAYGSAFTTKLPVLNACTAPGESDCFEKVNQKGSANASELPFPSSEMEEEAEEEYCEERKEGSEPLEEWEARETACTLVEEAEGWSLETSLDIEMAHAVCQNCKILLVEAESDSYEDLLEAEKTAVAHAEEISNSWGGEEPIAEKASEAQAVEEAMKAFEDPAKVITASSGDEGYLNWTEAEEAQFLREPYYVGADFPASSPDVVAVGGTELMLDKSGWQSEAVWNEDADLEGPNYGAGGSGCSAVFTAKPWQQAVPDWAEVGCGSKRAVADIAADADPYTGVAVYDSSLVCEYEYEEAEKLYIDRSHWCTLGGTSVASPIIAAMFALAGGSHGVEYPAQTLYEHLETPLLHRVSSGGNGECDNEYASGCSGSMDLQSTRFPFDCGEGVLICNTGADCAGSYYDGPAGVGTPNGIGAFRPEDVADKDAPECAHEEGKDESGEVGKGEEPLPPGSKEGPKPQAEEPKEQEQVKVVRAPQHKEAKPRALALTRRAIAALSLRRPLAKQVAFTFKLGAAARVHVTLAIRVGSRRHRRWRRLSACVVTFAGRKGRNAHSLASRRRLAKGRYKLTVTLQGGGARSIRFRVA